MKPARRRAEEPGGAERPRVLAGHQLVADGLADRVRALRVHDHPRARAERIDEPPRLELGLAACAPRVNALPCGFSGPVGHRLGVHLVAPRWPAVHVEVEPGAEEVLVVERVEARRDEPAVGRGARPSAHRLRGDDAGELDLGLRSCRPGEVPVEAVVVVADGGDERDDEPPRAPHLDVPVRKSVCFQSMPASSSCRQIAFGDRRTGLAVAVAERRRRSSGCRRGSRSRASASSSCVPMPYSPMSNGVLVAGRAGSPYGTTISASDARSAPAAVVAVVVVGDARAAPGPRAC